MQSEKTKEEIENWVLDYIEQALSIQKDKINTQKRFKDYGLDSTAAVILTGDLSEWLQKELDPTLLLDYPTIDLLCAHLAESK